MSGEIAPQRTRLAQRLIEIQDRQFEAMTPGARTVDVDAMTRRAMLEE